MSGTGTDRYDRPEPLQDAARDLASQAGRTAEAKASTTMNGLSQTLDQVAQAAREAGNSIRDDRPELAGLADAAADKATELSTYLRDHDAREFIRTAESAARRQPALVIAGAFAFGLAAGRLLRSANPTSGSSRSTMDDDWYSTGPSIRSGDGLGGGIRQESQDRPSRSDAEAGYPESADLHAGVGGTSRVTEETVVEDATDGSDLPGSGQTTEPSQGQGL
jgi:hypothetical protein